MVFPTFGWFGIIAVLTLLTSAAIGANRKIPAKRRFALHRQLAAIGISAMAIHALWALSRYL